VSDDRSKSSRSFSIGSRIDSFGHAFRGIGSLLVSERNAWIHVLATLVVVVAGLVLGIDRDEWWAVMLAIGLVWSAEAFNTAIEGLCDVVSPEDDPRIKRVKDMAAGGVLLAALAALGVGMLVFVPRIVLFLLS
jgi:diacylglycerol kinase (ATP)